MISARVCSRVQALSRGLPLHWQEHNSRLSRWTQHTDLIPYCSIYTPVTSPAYLSRGYSAIWVTPQVFSNMVQQAGFGQALTHELLLSHLPLFYGKRWGTAIEAGGDREISVAPLSTLCPAVPTMQPPAWRVTFALEGNPGDWDGLTRVKTRPWPPNTESDCSKEIYSNTLLTESHPPAIFRRLTG